jgi:hypothetical protein
MTKEESKKALSVKVEELIREKSTDLLVKGAKAGFSSLPIFGPFGAVLVDYAFSGQWEDRVKDVLMIFASKIEALEDTKQEELLENLRSPEGMDFMQEAIIQAGNAFTEKRREHIANLLKNSLTKEDIVHDEKKKLFKIFNQLNDTEIIYLKYYSMSIGTNDDHPFNIKHQEVLKPIRRRLAGAEDEGNAGAFRDNYIATLNSLGLVQMESERITNRTPIGLHPLGNILLAYLEVSDETTEPTPLKET